MGVVIIFLDVCTTEEKCPDLFQEIEIRFRRETKNIEKEILHFNLK